MKPIKIPATYMRGGTSKGVFLCLDKLPEAAKQKGAPRDQLLLRIIGSPDRYGKQIDGMGGGSSSTSKVVIVASSDQAHHDVDYLFGQVAINKAVIDWSGNCGNLTAAVGAFAITQGLVDSSRVSRDGIATVRIWQANIHKTIIVHIPMHDGVVMEAGDFEVDGVTFAAAKIDIEFVEPIDGALFPTGNVVDSFKVPDVGTLSATFINAGIATIFLNAAELGYDGTESQADINGDSKALAIFETIRAYGAVKMGLIRHIDDAIDRQHTPKIAFVAPPKSYLSSGGKSVDKNHIDLLVRALSMGQLHHAMMGTAAVAIATAAAIPGTLVNIVAGGKRREQIRFGHPSGTLQVGADVVENDGIWRVNRVTMSRSARVLMDGWVSVPADIS